MLPMLISRSLDSSHPRSQPRVDSQHHHQEAYHSSTLSSKRSRYLSAADSQRNIPRQRFWRRRRAQPPPGPHRSSCERLVSRPRQCAASHGMCNRARSTAIRLTRGASKPHDRSATRYAADAVACEGGDKNRIFVEASRSHPAAVRR
eukprot:COSAG02_NODE_2150_length_9660_cov_45.377889_3_plen_147_part_00